MLAAWFQTPVWERVARRWSSRPRKSGVPSPPSSEASTAAELGPPGRTDTQRWDALHQRVTRNNTTVQTQELLGGVRSDLVVHSLSCAAKPHLHSCAPGFAPQLACAINTVSDQPTIRPTNGTLPAQINEEERVRCPVAIFFIARLASP